MAGGQKLIQRQTYYYSKINFTVLHELRINAVLYATNENLKNTIDVKCARLY